MRSLDFEFSPADWDTVHFRAYFDKNGEPYCIAYEDEDGHWWDIEDTHWGFHKDYQIMIWNELKELVGVKQ